MTQIPILEPVYARLQQWIAETCADAAWSLSMPSRESAGADDKAQAVTYLLEVLRTPVARTDKRAPLRMSLRFLVCAWATKPEQAHENLVRLAFAAMDQDGWDLELDALPAHTWSAFGIPPRPSFVLRIPLLLERAEERAKRVRSIKLESLAITALQGSVLGPDDIPIAGATVEAPALHRWATTDDHGRFVLTGLPQAAQSRLVVNAKGKRIEVSPEGEPDPSKPLTIRLTLED
jgi:hypothetical protein